MSWLADLLARIFQRREPTPGPAPDPGPSPSDGQVADELLAGHNAIRARHGLPALAAEPRCQRAAQLHADAMARTGVMAHAGIGDGTAASRLSAQGYAWAACAENIADGYAQPGWAVDAWERSPRHLGNILGPYRHFGAAVARDAKGMPYWCAVFGSPAA